MLQKRKQLTGHNGSIFALSPAESDRYFLSGAGEGWVVRWDLEDPDLGKLVAKVETQIFALHYLAKEHKVVVGNMNGGVHWVDLDQPDNTINVAHHQKGVFSILEVGDHILTAGGQGMLTRWNRESGQTMESLRVSHQSLRAVAYNPIRHELAVGSSDHAIYILDAGSLEVKQVIAHAHDNSVFSLSYNPAGDLLFSGGRDAHLKVWDAEASYLKLSSQPAHMYTINKIVFHPNGKYLATGSRDKNVKIWDAQTFQLLKVLESYRDSGHLNSVNTLLWSKHRNCLISGSDDRSLILWEGL